MDLPPPIEKLYRPARDAQQAGCRRICDALLEPRYSGLALIL
jgi:hypothetical protein